jgi:hypothetical protein
MTKRRLAYLRAATFRPCSSTIDTIPEYRYKPFPITYGASRRLKTQF